MAKSGAMVPHIAALMRATSASAPRAAASKPASRRLPADHLSDRRWCGGSSPVMLNRSGLPGGLGSNPNVQDQEVCHAAGALWMFDRPIRAVVLKIACALTTFGVVDWNSVLAAAESE